MHDVTVALLLHPFDTDVKYAFPPIVVSTDVVYIVVAPTSALGLEICSNFPFFGCCSDESVLIVVFKIDATDVTTTVTPLVVDIVLEHLFDFTGDDSFESDDEDPVSVLLISAKVSCLS